MDIVELTKQLITFESTSYNELPLAQYLVDWLKKKGVPVVLDSFNPARFLNDGVVRPDTANVYATIGNGDQTLLLYAHMDVVKAPARMFEPRILDERLIGRGTSDMKSSLAGLMLAAAQSRDAIVASQKKVIFAFIADEETSGTGARRHIEFLTEQKILGNNIWCILTEPTDGFDNVEIGGMGYIFVDLVGDLEAIIMTLQSILHSRKKLISRYPSDDGRFGEVIISITTIACDSESTTERCIIENGRSAHASRPQDGDNALEKMLQRISGPIANIQTDQNSPNTIPSRCIAYLADSFPTISCRATIDIRTNLSSDQNDGLWTDFQMLLGQQPMQTRYYVRDRGKAYLTPTGESGPLSLCLRCRAPQPKVRVALGGSDAGYYALITPNVIGGFGPGEYSQLHTDSESISLSSLQGASNTFESLIRSFL